MARSEVNYIYDAANSFRAPGLAPLTADADVGTLALDKLVNVRPSSQRGKLGAEGYNIVIVVEAVTTAGAEAYAFNAVVDGIVVGTIAPSTTGQYVLVLDAASIEKATPNHADITLALDVTGVTASIKFSAWMV